MFPKSYCDSPGVGVHGQRLEVSSFSFIMSPKYHLSFS